MVQPKMILTNARIFTGSEWIEKGTIEIAENWSEGLSTKRLQVHHLDRLGHGSFDNAGRTRLSRAQGQADSPGRICIRRLASG